jgi:hypothetical protein
MAKIIEFYVPQSFRKVSKWLPPPERGKVLAFPQVLVSNSIVERLLAIGAFVPVQPYDGCPDIECVLNGRLEKLEEIDYEGGVEVEVAISAQMSNLATGSTVWTNSVSEVGDVDKLMSQQWSLK